MLLIIRKLAIVEERIYPTFNLIGATCLLISLILGLLLPDITWINFLEGMLMGISIVFNLYGLYFYGKLNRQKLKKDGKKL